MIHVGHAEHC